MLALLIAHQIKSTAQNLLSLSFSLAPLSHAIYLRDIQADVLARNREHFLERQRQKAAELRAETVATDWCYGPQKLNYVELKKVSEEKHCRVFLPYPTTTVVGASSQQYYVHPSTRSCRVRL